VILCLYCRIKMLGHGRADSKFGLWGLEWQWKLALPVCLKPRATRSSTYCQNDALQYRAAQGQVVSGSSQQPSQCRCTTSLGCRRRVEIPLSLNRHHHILIKLDMATSCGYLQWSTGGMRWYRNLSAQARICLTKLSDTFVSIVHAFGELQTSAWFQSARSRKFRH
jgi:hypothetical protein